MKHIILLAMLGLFSMVLTACAQQAEEKSSPQLPRWKFGFETVYQIEDTASGFASETFPTVERATFDKYATDGRIPSSVSAFMLEIPGAIRTGNVVYNGYVLFDATMGAPNGNFVANLGKPMYDGYHPERVLLVLITHLHGDHIGGLLDGDARRFPEATVLCSQPEYDHWSKQNNAAFERVKKAYGDDFRAGFAFDEAVIGSDEHSLVSVTPLNAVGHTPGHTVFLIKSAGEKLLVIGDLLHAAALQFPVPEACARFDMNQTEAVKARRRILDMAAEENIPIAGMHFPSPGMGFVKKNAASGYDFSPLKKALHISFRWNGNDSADYKQSVQVDYNKNGEYLRDQPAAEALAWLETELKSGNYTIIEAFDGDKRDYRGGAVFLGEIVKLSEKYQVPYSTQEAMSSFPGAPVRIHFPQEIKP